MRGWALINLMFDGGWIAMLAFISVVLIFYLPSKRHLDQAAVV